MDTGITTALLDFVGDKEVHAKTSDTILDNSLKAGINHVFECGGNARCSTCRVIIISGLTNCLPRNSAELELSTHKKFSDDIRLACQTKFKGDVKLKRLVFDSEDIQEAVEEFAVIPAKEQKLAILFADIRSFTPLAESNLPYDVVHILNRYFNAISKPIFENGGYIDKYIGDGIMVLFGLDEARKVHPCTDAMNAAQGICSALNELNYYLKQYFNIEIKNGIGIHYGTVITGQIGCKSKKDFTALGDAVNMAARIESFTKKAAVQILISEEVEKFCHESELQTGKVFESELSGKTGLFKLYELKQNFQHFLK